MSTADTVTQEHAYSQSEIEAIIRANHVRIDPNGPRMGGFRVAVAARDRSRGGVVGDWRRLVFAETVPGATGGVVWTSDGKQAAWAPVPYSAPNGLHPGAYRPVRQTKKLLELEPFDLDTHPTLENIGRLLDKHLSARRVYRWRFELTGNVQGDRFTRADVAYMMYKRRGVVIDPDRWYSWPLTLGPWIAECTGADKLVYLHPEDQEGERAWAQQAGVLIMPYNWPGERVTELDE